MIEKADADAIYSMADEILSLREEVTRLRKALRSHVIFRDADDLTYGTCTECDSEWNDGTEAHAPDCLAREGVRQ